MNQNGYNSGQPYNNQNNTNSQYSNQQSSNQNVQYNNGQQSFNQNVQYNNGQQSFNQNVQYNNGQQSSNQNVQYNNGQQSFNQNPQYQTIPQKKDASTGVIVTITACIVILAAFFITAFAFPGFLRKKDKKADNKNKNDNFTNTEESTYEPNDTSDPNQTTTEADLTEPDDDWTVLVYLCGSNLESESGLATYNIDEMINADITDSVNIIIETGGSQSWETQGVNPDSLCRFQMTDTGLVALGEVPMASMGNAATFQDFVSWGLDNYPAKKTMIIIWDHGSEPTNGVAFDELYSYDSLSLDELRVSLADTGRHIDIMGFDTCLMGNIETACAIGKNASYLVASEETIPGPGWNYTGFINYICENPGCAPADVGVAICDSYYQKYTDLGMSSGVTLSLIDLSYIDELSTAYCVIGKKFYDCMYDTNSMTAFYQAMPYTESYGNYELDDGSMISNLYDMGDFIDKSNGLLGDAGNNYKNVLSKCMLYQVKGDARAYSTGLAFYFPNYIDSSELDRYSEVMDDIPAFCWYVAFIDELYDGWDAPDWVADAMESSNEPIPTEPVVFEEDMTISYNVSINSDGFAQLDITGGLPYVANVDMKLYYLFEDNGTSYKELWGSDDKLENPAAETYIDKLELEWFKADGFYDIALHGIEYTPTYNLYSTPILLNNTPMQLLVYYDKTLNTYQMLYAYGFDENIENASNRQSTPLKAGDRIDFLMTATDGNGNFSYINIGDTIYSEDYQIITREPIISDIFADSYTAKLYYVFEITDVQGNKFETEGALVEIVSGLVVNTSIQ
ncbi:MAG: hypothetical protein J6P57_00810 [Lachnospiraceae bacterium]|nr:hypothetical protein [Lachnospiraceae bacterium]